MVVGTSRLAGMFCVENNISETNANILSVCIEEMADNIISHGFDDGKDHNIDIRILIKEGELILRMRDDCRPFDPMEQYNIMRKTDNKDKLKNFGIRLAVNMSKEVRYLSTLGTNNLIIKI